MHFTRVNCWVCESSQRRWENKNWVAPNFPSSNPKFSEESLGCSGGRLGAPLQCVLVFFLVVYNQSLSFSDSLVIYQVIKSGFLMKKWISVTVYWLIGLPFPSAYGVFSVKKSLEPCTWSQKLVLVLTQWPNSLVALRKFCNFQNLHCHLSKTSSRYTPSRAAWGSTEKIAVKVLHEPDAWSLGSQADDQWVESSLETHLLAASWWKTFGTNYPHLKFVDHRETQISSSLRKNQVQPYEACIPRLASCPQLESSCLSWVGGAHVLCPGPWAPLGPLNPFLLLTCSLRHSGNPTPARLHCSW